MKERDKWIALVIFNVVLYVALAIEIAYFGKPM
ncbi:hypothetical protein ZC03_054 [Pseudomonas phage ZC03]|uniref:Uncharacterized protein n=1 Tax=Pseudomonas phage ZC03 TaxID=1622115 RepID=A0A1L2C950_9CAUD|nr:hypothetical protein HWA93_gp75 [Pseudomonas phage ZC03]AMD43431.1 hypothetical protein ZC03_054 [Pseudomonas phage ZC03]